MFEAVVWGVVQGLTEFLPISSDGHLVLVPAFVGINPPDLETSALLHLGTLVAVVSYFRKDLWALTHLRQDPRVRRFVLLLTVGTLPSVVALFVVGWVSDLQESVSITAALLVVTGLVMAIASRLPLGVRKVDDANPRDALALGVAQLMAVLPGISRSGLTISTGIGRGFERSEAARFSFLLGIPAVAGAGVLEGTSLFASGGIPGEAWIGVVVAAVTGYAAIGVLLRILVRTGLGPFASYCIVVGTVALFVL